MPPRRPAPREHLTPTALQSARRAVLADALARRFHHAALAFDLAVRHGLLIGLGVAAVRTEPAVARRDANSAMAVFALDRPLLLAGAQPIGGRSATRPPIGAVVSWAER